MSKFYIGQKIVAIKDQSQGIFKKGDEFTVLSIKKCCKYTLIDIGIKWGIQSTICNCGNDYHGNWFSDLSFAPIELSTTTFEDVIKQVEPCLN